jgi:hypothetical protein
VDCTPELADRLYRLEDLVNDRSRERHVYWLLVVAAAMLLWALMVGITGGFVLAAGGLRLSSRGTRNVMIGFSLAVALAWAIAPSGRRWPALSQAWARLAGPVDAAVTSWDARMLHRMADALAAAVIVAVVVLGVTKGAFVIGGSDSYGYVSQAHLWATGTLRVEPPLAGQRPDGLSNAALTPLGYRLAPDEQSFVPTYAPGFPMLAAVFERVGGPGAVFYVMPLLAGVTVAATYLLGIAVAGRAVGLLAAVLMALSPAFLFQLTHAPMSDIVAACWWTLTLVLLPRASPTSSLCMGICAAAAILTRPNLVPLAVVPGGWLLRDVVKNPIRRQSMIRLALYASGPIAASLIIAGLNRYWYGSATASGYGALAGELFRWEFLWPNLVNYSRSMLSTQTPAIVLAALAPFLIRSSLITTYAVFVVVMYLCYAVYLPMEAWWGLRFFLPAFPIVMVFLSIAVVHGAALVPLAPRVLWPIVIAALIVSQTRVFIRETNVLDSTGEQRFARIGRYIADALPPQAVVFASMHSGSVTYYSGRVTVRYDALQPGQFTTVVRDFQRLGRPAFLLLDTFEGEDFARRFGAAGSLGTLDVRASKLVPSVELYQVR